MPRVMFSVLFAAILLAVPGLAGADREFNPRRLVAPFPPITEFPVKTVQEVGDELSDAELVLGVEIDGKARAYPINMLTGPSREILNDTLAGIAMAATW